MGAADRNKILARSDDQFDEHADWLETQQILEEARGETKRFLWFAMFPVLLLVVTAGVLLYNSAQDDESGSGLQSASTDDDAAEDSGAEAETGADGATAESEDATADGDGVEAGADTSDEALTATVVAMPEPPTGDPYVDATLSDNVFVLSGRVPNEETKLALEGRAELAYAPFFSSELVVDDSITEAEWLAAAPEIVGLLPMITDGTIRMQDGAITVAGRSPKAEYATAFQGALGQLTGLPVTDAGIQITDLVSPRFVATVTEGAVLLEGEIPSDAIAETFVQGAAAVYGPENVTSNLTVKDDTHTSFWMYTMPGVFQLFSPFPAYMIQVEEGVTSGSAQGGVLFDVNSDEITAETGQILGIAIALLARDRSLDLTVIGHTDSQGPRDFNIDLSVRRAQSVVDFMAAAGISADRVTAEGRGPDEPIGDNETEEGRALNRRVEFLFD